MTWPCAFCSSSRATGLVSITEQPVAMRLSARTSVVLVTARLYASAASDAKASRFTARERQVSFVSAACFDGLDLVHDAVHARDHRAVRRRAREIDARTLDELIRIVRAAGADEL